MRKELSGHTHGARGKMEDGPILITRFGSGFGSERTWGTPESPDVSTRSVGDQDVSMDLAAHRCCERFLRGVGRNCGSGGFGKFPTKAVLQEGGPAETLDKKPLIRGVRRQRPPKMRRSIAGMQNSFGP